MKHLVITCALAGALATALVPHGRAEALDYPTKPVTVIVPFPAGQASDVIVRIIGQRLGSILGQSIIVENRPGAGGSVGTTAGVHAEPDGHTVTLASAAYAITPFTHQQSFDALTDLVPVSQFAVTPLVLVANPGLGVDTVAELKALATERPGEIMFASSGIGTTHHLSGELFQSLAGVEMLHVPYAGSAQAHTDLISGRSDVMFDNIVPLAPHLARGTLKPLAVTTASRAPSLPDVPTMQEAGIDDFEATAWFGFLVPAGTPEPVIERLNAAMGEAMADPAVAGRLTEMGVEPIHTTPEAFGTFIRAEMDKWKSLIDETGIELGMQ